MTATKGIPESSHVNTKKTFCQRLRSMAWLGILAACVELLLWVRSDLWLYALIFVIPITAVGVIIVAAILHVIEAHWNKARDGRNAST